MSRRNFPAPRPWRLEGDTIRDAAGGVVVSAINPADRTTRRFIVEAANNLDFLRFELKLAKDDAESEGRWANYYFERAMAAESACRRLRAFVREMADCLEEAGAEAYRSLVERAREAEKEAE